LNEQVDKRFEVMTSRIDRFMAWSFATTLTVGGIVIAAILSPPEFVGWGEVRTPSFEFRD